MQAEKEFLAELLGDIKANNLTLPTLPEVALKVREVVDDKNATAKEVTLVVSTDAALSARLIQVANSPLYRARNPIDNVQVAIARLGQGVVRNLVTSLVMQQMFQATSDVTDTRLRALWEHSTQVAAISGALAGQFSMLQPDIAMLGGLVHAIGALPILVRAEDKPELLENEALLDSLIEKLHPTVGKQIMQAWDFPQELIKVVSEYSDLKREGGPAIDYVDIVQVANLQSYLGTDHPLAKINWTEIPAFKKLGLDADVSIVDMEGVSESVQEMSQVLM